MCASFILPCVQLNHFLFVIQFGDLNTALEIINKYALFSGRHILRTFVVDRIVPTIKKDWVTFGVYIGYDKNTLKLPKDKRVNNPVWQILRNWTETVEYLDVDPLKILYKALSKVNKSLQRDLLKLILHESDIHEFNKYMIKGNVEIACQDILT